MREQDTTHRDAARRLFQNAAGLFGRLPAAAADAVAPEWAELYGKMMNGPDTPGELFDCCGCCDAVTHAVIKFLAGAERMPEGTREAVTEFAGAVSRLNGALFDAVAAPKEFPKMLHYGN